MISVDWNDDKNVIASNLPEEEKEKLNFFISEILGHRGLVLIQSSGTSTESTNRKKWYGLKKEAFLNSAKAVGEKFGFSKDDIWLNPLPLTHVGGLAILARAEVFGGKVIFPSFQKWDAKSFVEALEKEKITHTSLVPTQIYDIIQLEVKAPGTLKMVFVGGGKLAQELKEKALQKGWPITMTYGMTETASMIATSEDEGFLLLDHFDVRINQAGLLEVKGSSLFHGILWEDEDSFQYEVREEGWYTTEDLVQLKNNKLYPLGRKNNVFKIMGELVSLSQLEDIWNQLTFFSKKSFLTVVEDLRKENEVVVFAEGSALQSLYQEIKKFNEQVRGFEKISHAYIVDKILRSELGKIKRSDIPQMIHSSIKKTVSDLL